jgi:hypothetical protein
MKAGKAADDYRSSGNKTVYWYMPEWISKYRCARNACMERNYAVNTPVPNANKSASAN